MKNKDGIVILIFIEHYCIIGQAKSLGKTASMKIVQKNLTDQSPFGKIRQTHRSRFIWTWRVKHFIQEPLEGGLRVAPTGRAFEDELFADLHADAVDI